MPLDPSAWLTAWIAALERRSYRPSFREKSQAEQYRAAGWEPDDAAVAFMSNMPPVPEGGAEK